MKKALHFTIVFMLYASVQILGQTTFTMNLMSGGINRNFRLYIPSAYTGQEPRPLVFQFHGAGSTNSLTFQNLTNFTDVADTANFILATPQGKVFPIWNFTDWNAYETASIGVDDVLFVSDMIDTLCKMYKIDTTRIYSAGYSSGAFFGYYLGWKLSNRIAAVGSVCGSIYDSAYAKIMPPKPVSIMEIHGTVDPSVPWAGGFWQNYWQIPVDTLTNFWVKNNECELTPTITDMPNTNTTDGCTAKRFVWANGKCGSEVQLLKIAGGQHTWPNWNTTSNGTCKDFFADVEMWRFFLKHPLGCNTSTAYEPQTTSGITIWPNPTSDKIKVSSDFDLDDFSVLDIAGRLLFSNKFSSENTIDLSNLANGIYFVRLKDKKGAILTRKVIKFGQ